MKYYLLSADESDVTVRLFSDYNSGDDHYRIIDYFKDVVCNDCGRIDEMRALHKPNLHISGRPPHLDIFVTYDGIFIVHDRLRDRIAGFDNTLFDFFPITNCSRYFAIAPKLVHEPYYTDKSFIAIGKECRTCHRYHEVIGGPTFPKIFCDRLTAYRLDKVIGSEFELIINSDFHNALCSKRNHFSGIDFFSF
jgi:hypothetical protein